MQSRIVAMLLAGLLSACGAKSASEGGATNESNTASAPSAPSASAPPAAPTASAPPASPGASGGPSASASTAPPAASAYDACETDADCAWGEIGVEIAKRADCMCLLGCPYIPLAKATVERRTEQYRRFCEPRMDGSGQPCPIDDCARPPPIVCKSGRCAAH